MHVLDRMTAIQAPFSSFWIVMELLHASMCQLDGQLSVGHINCRSMGLFPAYTKNAERSTMDLVAFSEVLTTRSIPRILLAAVADARATRWWKETFHFRCHKEFRDS